MDNGAKSWDLSGWFNTDDVVSGVETLSLRSYPNYSTGLGLTKIKILLPFI